MAHTKSLTQDTGGVVGSVTFPADATKYLDGTGAFTTPAGTGTGTVTNTGTLTDHAVIVGNGGVDVSALASLGTTTTVLHGNASADPAFSAVVEADITLADNTTNNVGTSKHGFAPKGDGDTSKFLNANGAYSTPSGTGAVSLIETQNPTGTTVSFTSLGSYTHLRILFSARGDQVATATNLNLTVNSDGGSNYDRESLIATAATPSSSESIGGTSIFIAQISAASAPAGVASGGDICIFDYAGTTFNKTFTATNFAKTAASSGGIQVRIHSATWRSTSAITRIDLALASGNFVSGSKFSLYGISG